MAVAKRAGYLGLTFDHDASSGTPRPATTVPSVRWTPAKDDNLKDVIARNFPLLDFVAIFPDRTLGRNQKYNYCLDGDPTSNERFQEYSS